MSTRQHFTPLLPILISKILSKSSAVFPEPCRMGCHGCLILGQELNSHLFSAHCSVLSLCLTCSSLQTEASLTDVQTVLINKSKHKYLKDSLAACICYKATVVHVPTKAYDLSQSWSLCQVCHTKHDFPPLEKASNLIRKQLVSFQTILPLILPESALFHLPYRLAF